MRLDKKMLLAFLGIFVIAIFAAGMSIGSSAEARLQVDQLRAELIEAHSQIVQLQIKLDEAGLRAAQMEINLREAYSSIAQWEERGRQVIIQTVALQNAFQKANQRVVQLESALQMISEGYADGRVKLGRIMSKRVSGVIDMLPLGSIVLKGDAYPDDEFVVFPDGGQARFGSLSHIF